MTFSSEKHSEPVASTKLVRAAAKGNEAQPNHAGTVGLLLAQHGTQQPEKGDKIHDVELITALELWRIRAQEHSALEAQYNVPGLAGMGTDAIRPRHEDDVVFPPFALLQSAAKLLVAAEQEKNAEQRKGNVVAADTLMDLYDQVYIVFLARIARALPSGEEVPAQNFAGAAVEVAPEAAWTTVDLGTSVVGLPVKAALTGVAAVAVALGGKRLLARAFRAKPLAGASKQLSRDDLQGLTRDEIVERFSPKQVASVLSPEEMQALGYVYLGEPIHGIGGWAVAVKPKTQVSSRAPRDVASGTGAGATEFKANWYNRHYTRGALKHFGRMSLQQLRNEFDFAIGRRINAQLERNLTFDDLAKMTPDQLGKLVSEIVYKGKTTEHIKEEIPDPFTLGGRYFDWEIDMVYVRTIFQRLSEQRAALPRTAAPSLGDIPTTAIATK